MKVCGDHKPTLPSPLSVLFSGLITQLWLCSPTLAGINIVLYWREVWVGSIGREMSLRGMGRVEPRDGGCQYHPPPHLVKGKCSRYWASGALLLSRGEKDDSSFNMMHLGCEEIDKMKEKIGKGTFWFTRWGMVPPPHLALHPHLVSTPPHLAK